MHSLLEESGVEPMSIADRARWLEQLVREQEAADPDFPSLALGAFEGAGGPLVGLAHLRPRVAAFEEIPLLRRSAEPSMRKSLEVVLSVVVRPSVRRRGIGRELGETALDRGFHAWDLSRIVSVASASAQDARDWMRRLGMAVERNLISPDGPMGVVGIAGPPGGGLY